MPTNQAAALRYAAATILDEATPATVHLAAILTAAADCHHNGADHLTNCGTCPLADAVDDYATHVNAGFRGARRILTGAAR